MVFNNPFRPDQFHNAKLFALYFIFYTLLTFPLFYFAYKYNLPKVGSSDIYHYLYIYQNPFSFEGADSPFVYRQVSALLVNLFVNSGLYYDAAISFYNESFSQEIYFAAIAVNWIVMLGGSSLISVHFANKSGSSYGWILSVTVCTVFFLQFSTIFHGFSESPDGVSVGLAMACYVAYATKRSALFLVLLIVSVFQRELLSPLFAIVIASGLLWHYYLERRVERREIYMLMASIFCCLLYLAIRLVMFPDSSGNHDNQTSISSSIQHLQTFEINIEFVRQVILSQNLLWIILFAYFFVMPNPLIHLQDRILSDLMLASLAAIVTLVFFSLAAGIGNNIGRILMYGSPFYMALLHRVLTITLEKNAYLKQ